MMSKQNWLITVMASVMLTVSFMLSEVGAAEKADVETPSVLHPAVPALDELAGDWLPFSQIAHYPSVHNFHGTLLCNKDLLSVSWLVIPPFSQSYHSGALYINGKIHTADQFRWYPYQALRRKWIDGLEVETTTRMVFEDNGVLFRIKLKNLRYEKQELDIKIDLVGIMSKFTEGWDWSYPQAGYGKQFPFFATEYYRRNIGPVSKDLNRWKAELQNNATVLLISDTNTPAHTAFAFGQAPDKLEPTGNQGYAKWKITLKPGETKTIDYLLTFGDKKEQVLASANRWAKGFDTVFQQAKDLWQKRFNKAFVPGNKHFSGNFPVLVTSDKKLRRIYYMSTLNLMILHRTNMPVNDRVYLTSGPRLGATIMFYWDTSVWSTVFALLDPKAMKEHLRDWLEIDLMKSNCRDYFSGLGRGSRYSANDMVVFKMLYTYLRVTGDKEFLNEKVVGKTVLQHMEELATRWKKLVREGDVLADFGDANNLLECVPTYINRVPSFNAASVWMMRTLAEIKEERGEKARAKELRADADRLAEKVLELYVPGDGVWCSLHRDGSKVEMRHCYDFVAIGRFMKDDITQTMKDEMIAFVERELLTKNWMRAQSLSDIAAEQSDRPDHGPMGACDAWPAQTMTAMCNLGHFDEALDFLHRTEGVTRESAYSQAREFYGPNKRKYDAPVRIAERIFCCRESCIGGNFADMIIRSLFGYTLDPEEDVKLLAPKVPRAFEGKLLHLRHKGKLYTITSTNEGLSVNKE